MCVFFGTCNSIALMMVAWDAHMGIKARLRTLVQCASIPQHPSHPLFVLLCIPKGWTGLAALTYSILEIPESQDDDAFFGELRSHYRTLHDFWYHWFDPRQFSLWHASRFVRNG